MNRNNNPYQNGYNQPNGYNNQPYGQYQPTQMMGGPGMMPPRKSNNVLKIVLAIVAGIVVCAAIFLFVYFRWFQTSKTVMDIPEDALKWKGHYYAVFENGKSWEDAKKYCESRGGHLAVITYSGENEALFQYMKKMGYDNAYFGLTDEAEEGVWKWCDGTTAEYMNWHDGEPNNDGSGESYGMFYYSFEDGTWNDGDFGGSTYNGEDNFICEWDAEE